MATAGALRPPPLVYLFGLPGAGKNYVGELLRDGWGMRFADADEWLLEDMRESLARGEGFTPAQRDRYYAAVAERIGDLKADQSSGGGPRGLAVAQATFKAQHRRLVAAAHPEARMWWIRAAEDDRMERLRKGGNRVDTELGKKMLADFEAPEQLEEPAASSAAAGGGQAAYGGCCHAVIESGTAARVREQIEALLGPPTSEAASPHPSPTVGGGGGAPAASDRLDGKDGGPPIDGLELQRHGESRCAHWHSALDVLAIQAPCCGRYYACASCHDACETHALEPWPASTSLEQRALQCGVCRHLFSIQTYISGPEPPCCPSPSCGAAMNPGCKLHWCARARPPPVQIERAARVCRL